MSCAAHGDVDLATDEKGLLVNAMAMGAYQAQAEASRRRIDGRLTAEVPAVPDAQESRFSPRIRTLGEHSSGKHAVTEKKHRLNCENEPHNLDAHLDRERQPPERDVSDADFAAEAHGFTGYENAGHGSSHSGSRARKAVINMNDHVTTRAQAQRGRSGETRLAGGEKTALRLWRNHTAHGKSMRSRPYEIVGYVVEGDMTLLLGNTEAELTQGDSFVIPADKPHSYRIDSPATIIEATAPPAPGELE
jgi:quercetin dioxygenase-like cupin family protein